MVITKFLSDSIKILDYTIAKILKIFIAHFYIFKPFFFYYFYQFI